MTRGRKPKPTALKRAQGNPGKRALNHAEPQPPDGMPSCPVHLSDVAREEWDRVAQVLHDMGVFTVVDRAGLAAYCQAYGRWVEAEEKLAQGPALIKSPSGHVQQSPWMGIANKQLELMGRYMAEFGMTPASRTRVAAADPRMDLPSKIEITWVSPDGKPARERLAEQLDRQSRNVIDVRLDETDADL